jgi:hypothetical protein
MTIIIYFDETKKNKQVIHPTNKFDGQVTKLVEAITHSDLFFQKKNYHSFEIIS